VLQLFDVKLGSFQVRRQHHGLPLAERRPHPGICFGLRKVE
jgi:hypothetical protein